MKGTREKIMSVSLDLFAQYGFDSVSVAQIAEKVGIKAPSLYKHFSSKKDILDGIITWVDSFYNEKSFISVLSDEKRLSEFQKIETMTPEEYSEIIYNQFKLVTSDTEINKLKRFFTIEQYKNKDFCKRLQKHQFDELYNYCFELIKYLQDKNKIANYDTKVLAIQLFSPVSVLIQQVDREQDLIKDAEYLIKNHIITFFRVYRKE